MDAATIANIRRRTTLVYVFVHSQATAAKYIPTALYRSTFWISSNEFLLHIIVTLLRTISDYIFVNASIFPTSYEC